jgi:hypothetical protein
MAEPWIAIIGILVVIALIVAYTGVILWLRSPNKGIDINLKQVAVLVLVGVLLVVLQRNPPYVVEEQRSTTVLVPHAEKGMDTKIISSRTRERWDRDSKPEPPPETVVSRAGDSITLKNGVTLIWHIDSGRLIAESALVVAAGALLCCLLRTGGSPSVGRAEYSAPANRPLD